jgi:hypothetical protein
MITLDVGASGVREQVHEPPSTSIPNVRDVTAQLPG